MRTRTSIELTPGGCRLVEVELPVRRRGAVGPDVRVRSFVSEVAGGDDPAAITQTLTALREGRRIGKETWVTIWGLRVAQQFLRLPPAKPADLEALAVREARKEIAPLETAGDRATVATVIGSEVQVGSQRRREVSLIAVSAAEVKRRIKPLVDAGLVVDGVVTPALALAAVARAQRDVEPGTAFAYVALNARATCLAIIRDGAVLFARELSWGHDLPAEAGSRPEEAAAEEAVAARLTSELKRSVLYFKQTFRAAVEGVVLCGDMPNLRALTGPLGPALDVPIKMLDSLVGIDAAALPEPAEQFRADVAALRLSIAVGADVAPPANLLPSAIRVSRAARTQVVRGAAAAAAALAIVAAGYLVAQRSSSSNQAERAEIVQQLALLEPEAARLDELRRVSTLATAQSATLDAYDSQGPRLARLLEALSTASPQEISLTAVTVQADGAYWLATISGIAVADTAATGQAAVNGLLGALEASPFVGAPIMPPSLRVIAGSASTGATGERVVPIPEGASGVEFNAQFRLAK